MNVAQNSDCLDFDFGILDKYIGNERKDIIRLLVEDQRLELLIERDDVPRRLTRMARIERREMQSDVITLSVDFVHLSEIGHVFEKHVGFHHWNKQWRHDKKLR